MKLPKLAGPAAAVASLALALAGVARASSLSSSVLGMFPKAVGEIGYVDLKAARQTAWFSQYQSQMLPIRFQHFERYLVSAGMDLEKQVEEIAWVGSAQDTQQPANPADAQGKAASGGPPAQPQQFTGEEVVGIGIGNFAPDQIDAFFKKQKLPTVSVRGYTLYVFGSGMSPGDLFFFFLDSNTVAFGHREMLEKLIGVRFGDEESFLQNETLSALVDEVNGQGAMWMALDQNYSKSQIARMMPDLAQFEGATKMLGRVKGMTVSVQMDSGIIAQVTPQCGSTDDALTMAQLLQAGLLIKRYQASQSTPDVAKALDATTVSADGDHLKIRTQLADDLLLSLLRSGTLSLPM
ncbi:MAG TPA: hypothetical protein VMI93_05195 [Candidatus Solibacter sp.]|nr:hypothetical protein [Candidatus Solibacter sp.]